MSERIEFLTDPKVIKAAAHPMRVRLLSALDGREASPSQLAKEFGAPLGTVSYHVRTLHDLGLLRLVGEERRRGAVEHRYTTVRHVIPGNAWNDLPRPLRRQLRQSMLERVLNDISSASSAGTLEGDPHFSQDSLILDEEGARELGKEVWDLRERALKIEAEAKERLKASGTGEAETFDLVLMLFRTAG